MTNKSTGNGNVIEFKRKKHNEQPIETIAVIKKKKPHQQESHNDLLELTKDELLE